MAKKAAVKKDGSATPAVTEKAVGRAPKVKGTPIDFFGEICALFDVASGELKDHRKNLSLDERPEVKEKVKSGSASSDESSEDEPEAVVAPETAKAVAEFLHYRHEKLEEVRKLSEDERVAYEEFAKAVKASKGIHAQRIVPCTAVYGCAHTKVHFLNPAGDEDSQKFYHMLYDYLYAQAHSLIGEYVSGNTRSAIAINAEKVGLVMWQLPRPTKMKNPIDHITQDWRNVVPNRYERESFDELCRAITAPQLNEADIEDPVQAYLLDVWLEKKRRRHKLLASTSNVRPSLTAALKLALKANSEQNESESGGPNKPR